MTVARVESRPTPAASPDPAPAAGREPVDCRRVRRPLTYLCFSMSLLGAISASLGSMVAGRLADDATSRLLWLLAMCVGGGAVLDTVAKTMWATVCDRAEGRLRSDLLDAAMAQPLSELSERAVGEILDRIDDDTWEVGQLMRWGVWQAAHRPRRRPAVSADVLLADDSEAHTRERRRPAGQTGCCLPQ